MELLLDAKHSYRKLGKKAMKRTNKAPVLMELIFLWKKKMNKPIGLFQIPVVL